MIVSFVISLLAGPDLMPVTAERGAYECVVKGVLIHEGLMVVRCDGAAPDGVRLFAVEREQKRYENLREAAEWALEKGRPLGLLYAISPDKNMRGCDVENCRVLLGAERR